MAVTPISLEVFKNLLASVAEEMGVSLGRTAFSPNMKERLDYSCALFDPSGQMVAQAAHIPVHLGSMPESVAAALKQFSLNEGDIVILNDPYLGGTHLPDITLVAPVFAKSKQRKTLVGYVANRGHHADIGGMTPGSLPLSTDLHQEGLIIPPLLLAEKGKTNEAIVELLCRNSRTPTERRGDLDAQIAACRTGEIRLREIVERYGWSDTRIHMHALLEYSERLTRLAIRNIPDGTYEFHDFMDDDGISDEPVPIQVKVTVRDDEFTADFTGTSEQRNGCTNAPLAITQSAVLYVIRCLMPPEVPANAGCIRPLKIIVPEKSLLNPQPPHAVAGGNVETSQRIVDVLLGALAKALPEYIPAGSYGTMNNLLVGGHHHGTDQNYVYYETIAGGMGARPTKDGVNGIQMHMTNTRNTPIEAIEMQFPFRLLRYSIRREPGGEGMYKGGYGLVREYLFMSPATVTVLSERRRFKPYGLNGGQPGTAGKNILFKSGVEEVVLPPKITLDVEPGDVLSIHTPGGGGWGQEHGQ